MVVGFRVLRQSFCRKFEFSADFSVQLIQFFGDMRTLVWCNWYFAQLEVGAKKEKDPLRIEQKPGPAPGVGNC